MDSASSSSPGRRRNGGAVVEDECCKRHKTVVTLADSPTSPVIPSVTPSNPHVIDCGICFDSEYEYRGKLDSCNHGFCLECISKWATTSTCCPLCKQRFLEISKMETSTGCILAKIPCAKRDFGTPVPQLGQMYNSDGEEDDEDDDFYGDDYDDEDGEEDDHGPFGGGLFWNHPSNPFFSVLNMFGGGGMDWNLNDDEDDEDDEDDDAEEEEPQQQATFCAECGLLTGDCTCHHHEQADNTVITLDDDDDDDDEDPETTVLIQQGSGSADQPFELADSDDD